MKSIPPNLEDIKQWVSAILAEVNIGLLIYHLEDITDFQSLRLLYTNKAASEFTGADLSALEGKRILDAFPGLAEGELPEAYADVVRNKRSIELGTTEYGGDDRVEPGFYSVKAFPMPSQCVGIIFENITVRKKVEELVKKERERTK
ncbi:MAG: PAS domain-containing protein [Rhodothermia bacterium]|nr:PAS domain-containing protein [Rhodothermia bacterium]